MDYKNTKITPLSLVTMGDLNALVFNQETEVDGVKKNAIMVAVKHTAGSDPHAIPIMEIPALVQMLKTICEPLITVRPLPVQLSPKEEG